MQEKQDSKEVESQTLRYRILPLFSTHAEVHKLPLCGIETACEVILFLQVLKFPVDYFSQQWFGKHQPVFSFLDLSFYEKYMSAKGFQSALLLTVILITFYWMGTLGAFLTKLSYGETISNVRRLLLILFSTVLLMPVTNTILNLLNCSHPSFFRSCLLDENQLLLGLSLFTFVCFFALITVQSLLRFEFMEDEKSFTRIRNSSYMSVGLMGYALANEISFYFLGEVARILVMDLGIILLLTVFFLKDEHYLQWARLLQLTMLTVNLLPIGLVNVDYFLKMNFTFSLLLMLWPVVLVGVPRVNLHNMQFELENINKWNTPAVMMRYAETLRKLLKKSNEYYFQIYFHGYMEIHRQKCDNPTCPYNVEKIRPQDEMLSPEQTNSKLEEVIRTEGIIKKIYNDGCRVTPVNPQLQLQYGHFLFDINEKEAALKHLLLLKYQQLPFDKYYKYFILKEKIHNEMCEKPEREFLDLVSELEVKRKEEEIIQKFEQAALINLEFWSVLNQDHPDFQKLNEIGSSRVRIGQEVRERYEEICQYAHSEKITNLYVHFLTSIQNNEEMYNVLYEGMKKKFGLDRKIVLQDWSNSSQATLLVSIQLENYGTMIDLNSTCASLFGYEKYEVVNRHFRTMFSEELRDQIKSFLNPQVKDQPFFLVHKNSYLLKVQRRIQTYNSMETGMTSICTLHNVTSLNNCFLVIDSSEKILGLSSSCISLLGIDSKIVEQVNQLKNLFTLSLEDFKGLSLNGGPSFKINDVLKFPLEMSEGDYRRDSYTISYHSLGEQLFWLEFSVGKPKVLNKNIGGDLRRFQFQVQATLEQFRYLGVAESQQLGYLSQFSQLNFAESLKNNKKPPQNYGENIGTLRLKDNIIQVIEDTEQQLSQMHILKEREALEEEMTVLARKDEEAIFSSKEAYQQFIQSYHITKSVRLILILGTILAIGAYVGIFFVFENHNQDTTQYFEEIAYQNLIIGTMAKEYALITTLELMKAGVSKRIPTSFYTIYMANIEYLQSIKLRGSSPYPLKTYISADTPRNFYSDEFLLSFINYAIGIASGMKGKTTQQELVAEFNNVEDFKIEYLKLNGEITRKQMYLQIEQREQQILNEIGYDMHVEILMLVGGLLLGCLFGAVLLWLVHQINQEKVRTLQVFLGITQPQIQKFSSKTQKFLVSLHVEDTTGELDLEQEGENKRGSSSTFAKKKRFKLVKLDKGIYAKVVLIPLIAQAFFLQSFFESYRSLEFMHSSIPYVALTSQADNKFYGGIGVVQNAILARGTNQTGLSNGYLEYYRQYFNTHYQTFGRIGSFHQAFTSIFMEDICDGTIQIPNACNLPLLAKNGTLLVFTDITVRTEKSDFSQDFTNDYYVAFAVVSASHKYLTMLILEEQKKLVTKFSQDLLNYLVIWILMMSVVCLLYGVLVLNGFLKEVNQNKNMLALLPVSIARTMPQVRKYVNLILNSR